MTPRALESGLPRRAGDPAPRSEREAAHGRFAPQWAYRLLTAPPEERQTLLAEAAANAGLTPAPSTPQPGFPARFPPHCAAHENLANGEAPPPASFAARQGPSPAWFNPDLTLAEQLAVERALRAPDLFCVRTWDAEPMVFELLRQAAAAGERILLCGAAEEALERLTRSFGRCDEMWPVLFSEVEAAGGPLALRKFRPAERATALASAWASEQLSRRDALRKHSASLRSLLQRMAEWRAAAAEWSGLRGRIAELSSRRAEVADGLRREAAADDGAPAGEWRRLRESEMARHVAAHHALAESVAAAAAEAADAETELAKWRGEQDHQAKIADARSFPNPLSLLWWRTLLQGRHAHRLDELKARVLDAEILAMSARAQRQIAEENVDAEERRHHSALEQILKTEAERRLAELNAELAEKQTRCERLRESWRAWLRPLDSAELEASEPDLALLDRLEGEWTEALTRSEAGETAPEQATDAALAEEAARLAANVVVVSRGAFTAGGAELERWLQPGFDRLVILNCESMPHELLVSMASWAQAVLLTGSPTWRESADAGSILPQFSRLWSQLWPAPPLPLRWLKDGDRWNCLWTGLTAESEKFLLQEPLADRPEIDLFILSAPNEEPRLAAIGFPADSYTLEEAKRLHAEELGESAIDPLSNDWLLREEGDRLIAEFIGQATELPQPVPYEGGITEWIVPIASPAPPLAESLPSWRTRQLDFSRAAGWTWPKVQAWFSQRWHAPDLSRAAVPAVPLSRPAELAKALALLCPEAGPIAAPSLAGETCRRLRWERPTAEGAKPKAPAFKRLDGGKVLLSPEKIHPSINLAEAKSLVQAIDQVLRSSAQVAELAGNGDEQLSLLVVAQTAGQREQLRRQWSMLGPAAAKASPHFALLQDLRGRQADILALSLWPESLVGTADAEATLHRCATLVLAARKLLLLSGDLSHLIPPRLLASPSSRADIDSEAQGRLRSFRDLLMASVQPVPLATPAGAPA